MKPHMLMKVFVLPVMVLGLLTVESMAGLGAGGQFAQAVKAAKSGQEEFAYMHYRGILREFPDSSYKSVALLGVGEYFFNTGIYEKALEPLQTYIATYTDDSQVIFAQAILMKMAGEMGNGKLAEEQRKKIVAFKANFPRMKQRKVLHFRSPLRHRFKAVFQPKATEFYRDGELFLSVPI